VSSPIPIVAKFAATPEPVPPENNDHSKGIEPPGSFFRNLLSLHLRWQEFLP
jgi:hypothetical protein